MSKERSTFSRDPMLPHGPETRLRLLHAACRTIHRNGFRATSLKDILVDTGLTKGAFYHYFATKAALGAAIIDEVLLPSVEETWVRPLEEADAPFEALRTLLADVYVDAEPIALGCPVANLATELAAVDEVLRQRVETVYERWISAFARAISQGQESGRVRPDVNVRDAAAFLVASLAGSRCLAKTARSAATFVRCREQILRYLDSLRP